MELHSVNNEYVRLGELDKVVSECRVIANKLSLIISWRIKKRTATVFLKYNGHIVWQNNFTNDMPHMVLCNMYAGVQQELYKRTMENNESIARMRRAELERLEEKRVMNLPSWQERRNSK
ncbi:hypothetical protein Q765_00325 [Flavobacterium rivuli WB 3.3-2 = DSM 21788]|uniref:Uncharacterized protein n=1 Tax=Flavobacterium rivuli WB 3.3-2 = DSM 21788 TaxID=1121895 RepID=A0A0A2M6W3_9FLAO|nr:hypothetical protein [Flavobacterium rivuli]KGO88397.1 hypothetical protein Q765_00325 [Flavobacterium rivuli WB 3.3-2 = DSM 21788]